MNSEPSSTTAPLSICTKDNTAPAADAVSTDNQSSTEIAAAVAAALVAASISGSTGNNNTKKNAAVTMSEQGKKGGRDWLYVVCLSWSKSLSMEEGG